jgi:hypothetical protein
MTHADQQKLSLRAVFAEMFTVYRAHWRFLIPAAIVVLLPQSIADGALNGGTIKSIKSIEDVAYFGAILLTVVVNLGGQAFYAGVTAATVVDWRAGQPLPPIRKLIAALPVGGLIMLDIVVSVGTAIGLILLIVPGLIFLAYVGISPAVMKLEHLGVFAAMRRSVELVRGHLRQVIVIVLGVTLFTEIAVQLIIEPFHGLAVVTLIDLIAEGILQPFEGLAIAVVAIRLLELRGEAPAPSALAKALLHEES